jgi:hypothetical protein
MSSSAGGRSWPLRPERPGTASAEVVCDDDDQLLEILGQVRSLATVTTTETLVYLKLRKQTYHWGSI